jgi:triosephosphate isomerase
VGRTVTGDRVRVRVRRRLIAANWKMHKTIGEATRFVDELLPRVAGLESVDVVICPAYPALGPTV